MRRSILVFPAALWVAGMAMASTPPPGTPDPTTALGVTRLTLEQARVIVASDRTHNQKLDALHELLKNFLDTDTMGRAALADHWKSFSAAQQKEFLNLFRELFQRTYVQKLLLFEKPDFEYKGEAPLDGRNARRHLHHDAARRVRGDLPDETRRRDGGRPPTSRSRT